MHSIWKTSIRFTLVTTVLLGLAYPLTLTWIAGMLFPRQASGSLIIRDGHVIGSSLLAQGFSNDRYFHPRPSVAGTGYDAANSGGSNLAQSNQKLVDRVQGDIDKLTAKNQGRAVPPAVPIDMVTTSGSGLDPDITPDSAYYQMSRVTKARHLNETVVHSLIAGHVKPRTFGVLGEPRVNVMELNLDLDRLNK